jgi:chromosome segregation ATPase
MAKATGAVAMLVSTIKQLKETEAQLSAAEEELDIAKTDLGKTGAELRATTQELLKTKANLEESRERTLALETSTAEMSSRLEATTATLATTTRDRDAERSGRLQANLAKATFRMLKNKFQADAENAADALVDAEEALEAAKTSRAVAHVNAAQAKIRLALLRNGKLAGGPPREPEDGRPPSFVSDAKIMEGTPEDLVPYQKMLAEEYHAASVALKTGPTAAE